MKRKRIIGLEWGIGTTVHTWIFPFKFDHRFHEDWELTFEFIRDAEKDSPV